jgi:hypothetical protein
MNPGRRESLDFAQAVAVFRQNDGRNVLTRVIARNKNTTDHAE